MVRSILVGTDGSPTAATAVTYAIELARALGARLQIVSAYVAEGPPAAEGAPVGESPPMAEGPPAAEGAAPEERPPAPPGVQWTVHPRGDVLALLASARREAEAAGVAEIETFPRVGDAADAIIDVAEEQRADLIVVGNKGMTGATRFLLGSVPNKVSHHAPCSVLIVRTS